LTRESGQWHQFQSKSMLADTTIVLSLHWRLVSPGGDSISILRAAAIFPISVFIPVPITTPRARPRVTTVESVSHVEAITRSGIFLKDRIAFFVHWKRFSSQKAFIGLEIECLNQPESRFSTMEKERFPCISHLHTSNRLGWYSQFSTPYIATHNVNRWNNTGLPISRHDSGRELSECRDSIFFSAANSWKDPTAMLRRRRSNYSPSIHDWMPSWRP